MFGTQTRAYESATVSQLPSQLLTLTEIKKEFYQGLFNNCWSGLTWLIV